MGKRANQAVERLGAITPAINNGEAASAPVPTAAPVSVTIGGSSAQASFSGLVPGMIGVYQVMTTVPNEAPTGDAVPMTIMAAGQISPTVTMAIQPYNN